MSGDPVLVGRAAEIARITGFLDRLATGNAGMVVEGEAGIGKSSLLATATADATARGWWVLACRPAEAEAGYAYAGLADLVGDTADEVPGMPRVQRLALDVAMHRADADQPVDAHVVAVATVTLLTRLAGARPVLVVVDDLQWLDRASESVLDFASRRLAGHPVGLLVARRADAPGAPPWELNRHLGDFHQLWLSGLSHAELHEVLHRQLGVTWPQPTLKRLHDACRGNPFMAAEMARALRRAAPVRPGDPWPVPESLVRLIAPQLQALGPDTRPVLLAAAAMASPTVERLRAALGDDVAAGLEVAEHAGLIRLSGNRIEFTHPLFASVLYGDAPPPLRRDTHRRLAAVEPELETRARHLALATIGPDESVATALEAAATDVRMRGAVGVAADLLRLARSRTPADQVDAATRRMTRLADALFDAGDLTAARELLDDGIPGLPAGPDRARALMVRGTIAWYQDSGVAAAKLLESALPDAEPDRALVGQLHSRLAVFYDNDCPRSCRHAGAAVAVLEEVDEPDLLAGALINLFYTEAQLGQVPRPELLERALALENPRGSTDRSTIPGIWYLAVDPMLDQARDRFSMMLERSRERGDVSGEADVLTRLGEVELVADNYAAAMDYATAARTAALQLGGNPEPPLLLRALVDAHIGRLAEAREVGADGVDRTEATGELRLAVAYLRVLAFVAVSDGDPALVLEHAERAAGHLRTMGIREPVGRLDPAQERISALVELDRLEEAERELADFAERYERFPRPWMVPVLVRSRAQLTAARGDVDAAIAETDLATGAESAGWRRFDRARALLVRGRLLRRARRSGAAIEALTEAEQIFTALGAPVWAAMAGDELSRVGRRRTDAALTATERRVAEHAARGLTNREVAVALYMSPKTVEAHLGRAYRKLGIRSRAELGRLMGSD